MDIIGTIGYLSIAVCLIYFANEVWKETVGKDIIKSKNTYYKCKTSTCGLKTSTFEASKNDGINTVVITPTMVTKIISATGSEGVMFFISIADSNNTFPIFSQSVLSISEDDFVKLASMHYRLMPAKIINMNTGEEVNH